MLGWSRIRRVEGTKQIARGMTSTREDTKKQYYIHLQFGSGTVVVLVNCLLSLSGPTVSVETLAHWWQRFDNFQRGIIVASLTVYRIVARKRGQSLA